MWLFSFLHSENHLFPKFHSLINFGLMHLLILTCYCLLSASFWHNFPVQSNARSLTAWKSQIYQCVTIAYTVLYLSCFMPFSISSGCLHIGTDSRNIMVFLYQCPFKTFFTVEDVADSRWSGNNVGGKGLDLSDTEEQYKGDFWEQIYFCKLKTFCAVYIWSERYFPNVISTVHHKLVFSLSHICAFYMKFGGSDSMSDNVLLFWNVVLCGPTDKHQCFRRIYWWAEAPFLVKFWYCMSGYSASCNNSPISGKVWGFCSQFRCCGSK